MIKALSLAAALALLPMSAAVAEDARGPSDDAIEAAAAAFEARMEAFGERAEAISEDASLTEAQRETRIAALWADTRARFGAGGPYLFGAAFTNADVMYAPVVCRLLTYQPPLSAAAQEYCAAVRAHPLMEQWYAEAAQEPAEWHLEKYEAAP